MRQEFGEKAYPQAIKVATCESGMNPKAVNGSNRDGSKDYGLFQINTVHMGRVNGNKDALMDVQTNVKVAAQIYKEQGWAPWVCAHKVGLVSTLYGR